MSAFFISEKLTLKMEPFFKSLPYIQRAIIQNHKVRHPDFL